MKDKLKCVLHYEISDLTREKNKVNYLCHDKRIHVRLRDFDKTQTIKGFERKLAFLITLSMNPDNKTSWDDALAAYAISANGVNIASAIASYTDYKAKGIIITPNYRRGKHNMFGNCRVGIEVLNPIFKLGVSEFLFNDNYYLTLEKAKLVKQNKFEKKQIKKDNTEATKTSDFVELW